MDLATLFRYNSIFHECMKYKSSFVVCIVLLAVVVIVGHNPQALLVNRSAEREVTNVLKLIGCWRNSS